MRSWPAGVLEAIFPWAAANAAPEIYLMDPTFNGTPGWEAKLDAIARLNATGIPLHTELRLEHVDERHAALFRRAGFRSVEAGLQSTNPAALRAVPRGPGTASGSSAALRCCRRQGIEIRPASSSGCRRHPRGLPRHGPLPRGGGSRRRMEVYPLAVLPGTDLRRDAAALGIAYQRFPPYHVLSTPTMSADGIAESIRWLERELDAEFFAPVAPAFRDPAPGLTGFLDLRIPGALEAARASPERLANNLTLLAGDDLLRRPGSLEGFGRWLLEVTPSSLVQLVLETDAPLEAGRSSTRSRRRSTIPRTTSTGNGCSTTTPRAAPRSVSSA